MLRFVNDNIKLYNVRELRVHLTEASPKVFFVQNLFFVFCERFEVIMYNQVSVSVVTTLYVLYSLFLKHAQISNGAFVLSFLPCTLYSEYTAIGAEH